MLRPKSGVSIMINGSPCTHRCSIRTNYKLPDIALAPRRCTAPGEGRGIIAEISIAPTPRATRPRGPGRENYANSRSFIPSAPSSSSPSCCAHCVFGRARMRSQLKHRQLLHYVYTIQSESARFYKRNVHKNSLSRSVSNFLKNFFELKKNWCLTIIYTIFVCVIFLK